MGGVKESILDSQSNYSSPDDRFVCPSCVTDHHLANVIASALQEVPCSYCGAARAADITVLLDEINAAISFEYTDPAEELIYDGREGGYQGTTIDGYDAVRELEDWTDSEELLEDVANAFLGNDLCRREYYELDDYEHLQNGWKRFSTQVKYYTRFLFLQETEDELDPNPRNIPPGKMLDELGKIFCEYHLFITIPTATEFTRIRVVGLDERPSTAFELGTAPRDSAKLPNRMSPAGIPMFYAALNEKTAVLETYDSSSKNTKKLAIARFKNLRNLHFLNLTLLPDIPSKFDRKKRHRILPIRFLHSFVQDITRPIQRDKYEHTEYVPTQVVTEFVRHRLKTSDGFHIDGILYKSSRDREQSAVVIFADNEHCGPREKQRFDPEPFLEFIGVRYADPSEFF